MVHVQIHHRNLKTSTLLIIMKGYVEAADAKGLHFGAVNLPHMEMLTVYYLPREFLKMPDT